MLWFISSQWYLGVGCRVQSVCLGDSACKDKSWSREFVTTLPICKLGEHRCFWNSIMSLTDWQVVNWIVAFTTPILLAHFSYGVNFLFDSASLLVVAVRIFFKPEARGKSLEDIDASFRGKVVDTGAGEPLNIETIDRSAGLRREKAANNVS